MKLRRRVLVSAFVVSLLGGSALAACLGTNAGAPPSTPVARGAAGDASPSTRAMNVAPSSAFEAVLDRPQFAEARAKDLAKDAAGAADAFRAARARVASPTDAQTCAWSYVEGRLLAAASALDAAAAAYDQASAEGCPLAGWAKLRAAQTLVRAGQADAALARARSVTTDASTKSEVDLVIAEALQMKGDVAGALPLLRAQVAANGYGPRWVDTHVRLAQALLDGKAGRAEEHAREAYDLATKVVVEAPKLTDVAGATDARLRAVALLAGKPDAPTRELSDAERVRQAQAWLDLGEPRRALDLASTVVGAGKKGAVACKAAVTRANAVKAVKGAASKGDPWSEAVAACEGDEALVTTLYTAAKARAGKDPRQASAWFKAVEERFAMHRLADDARFRRALLAREGGDDGGEARAEELLRTLPDAFPQGDMRTEALFRAAQMRLDKSDVRAAKPLFEKILEIDPKSRHWATAGRAAYFRARVAELEGDRTDAKARYRAVLEEHPLAYYMLLSYRRLEALEAGAGKRAIAEARARAATAEVGTRGQDVLSLPSAIRGVRLLEVGEVDGARKELGAALRDVTGDGPDAGQAAWIVGGLYTAAGHPELGHAFARGPQPPELFGFWPEGRWRAGWEAAYPRAFAPLVDQACAAERVDRSLAWAIMREESSFYPEVKSSANAFGLMQLIVPTASWVAAGTPHGHDEASLKTPEVSIALGVKLLGKLEAKHGHRALAIGAYNSGSGAVDRWLRARGSEELDVFVEHIPYEETRNYVKRVLASQAAYAFLDGDAAFDRFLGLSLGLPH